mgnify:CR=1 FL=1
MILHYGLLRLTPRDSEVLSLVSSPAHEPAIRLTDVSKSFGSVTAVDHLNLDIADGEFFSMLGPSGSGKTTVLRIIAGFEPATSGRVVLAGEDVTDKAPFDRNVNTVFQDYALFPHMSVLENVEYGLRVAGVSKSERSQRALEALATVRLEEFASRKPAALSGGQRQRVALARAIVVRPKVLLLDEPLGALDLKLREQMQLELKALQRELGISFVFVTHDQEEALTLSDRVAVFNQGRIEQIGTPRELYDNPQSEFVAKFVGTSNVFGDAESKSLLGASGTLSVRPEKIAVSTSKSAKSQSHIDLDGEVIESIYIGSATRLIVEVSGGKRLTVLRQSISGANQAWVRGQEVSLQIAKGDLVSIEK